MPTGVGRRFFRDLLFPTQVVLPVGLTTDETLQPYRAPSKWVEVNGTLAIDGEVTALSPSAANKALRIYKIFVRTVAVAGTTGAWGALGMFWGPVVNNNRIFLFDAIPYMTTLRAVGQYQFSFAPVGIAFATNTSVLLHSYIISLQYDVLIMYSEENSGSQAD